MAVIIATQPRAYREALAAAVRLSRPDILVTTVEPAALDQTVEREPWQVAICSHFSDRVSALVPYRVALYPDGSNRARIHLAGRETVHEALDLADILAVIDQAGRPDR